jgi:two-component sensor histidine kinase
VRRRIPEGNSPANGPAGWAASRRLGEAFVLTAVLMAVLCSLTLGLWRAEVRIDPGLSNRAPTYVLWGGLAISLLMSGAVLQALLHRARVQDQTQKQLVAIESLHSISTAIGAQISAGTALDALAIASHRLLRMDRAVIAMLNDQDGTLQLVAGGGAVPPDFPKVFKLKDLPASSYCLQNNVNVYEGDVRRPTRSYGSDAIKAFEARSLILIPLRLDNRPIGLLTLSSSRPKEFTDLDRQIGELLGSQASVVLSNQQLYQQMRSALESSQKLLRQRQALSAAYAIQCSGAIEDALSQIVSLVPAAIGTDVCGLTLVVGPQRESVLAAFSEPYGKLVGRPITPTPLTDEAFAGRKPVIVSDARHEPRLHSAWANIPDVGSILYVPLFRADREPLGMMALARHQTGSFSQEQIELAQTFSSLAALAVENARLLEQTREDGETKTMLLRELNHRVKNNLTGIVGLLELSPPSMPAEIREWLNRAMDRIRSMAGAHGLFVGGVGRVPLESLVAQTLSACVVNKPAGVSVNTDLNGVRRTVGPEQAVALAMVLNELCYNAMVHGLRDGGTLTIKVREGKASAAASGQTVVIEVADNGLGCCKPGAGAALRDCEVAVPSSVASESSGHGLELVKGLVRRELRGTFALRPADGGGTTAIMEFPLPREEQ